MTATTLRTTGNYTLEDIVKVVVSVLQPELLQQEPPELKETQSPEPEVATNPYAAFEDYPEILQAKHCRKILGLSEPKTYEVMNSHGFPLLKIAGNRKLVRKEAFIKYLLENEGVAV